MADADFEYFLTKLPRTQEGPACTEDHLKAYRDEIPKALLSYWKEFGFSGFGDGIIWRTDPLEWGHTTETLTAELSHPDLGESATYIPYARSAFGEVYFWTPGFGRSLSIDPVYRLAFFTRPGRAGAKDRSIQSFFGSSDRNEFDLKWNDVPLFESVLERCGPLTYDLMYGFVPAVALGGAASVETASPFDIHVHLELLKEFAGEWQTSYVNL